MKKRWDRSRSAVAGRGALRVAVGGTGASDGTVTPRVERAERAEGGEGDERPAPKCHDTRRIACRVAGPALTLVTPGRGAVPAPVRGVPDLQPRMRRCRPRARPGELTRRGRAVIPDRGRFRRAVFSGAPLGVRPRGSAPPLGESNQAPSHQAGPVHLGPGDVAGPALGLPPRPDLSRVREIAG